MQLPIFVDSTVRAAIPLRSATKSTWERLTPALVIGILSITSIWISFGRFQNGQHADSIVPVLTSLQHWTPYYWDTDRYGMLLPLLAMPFRNPLTNMCAQSALGVFAALACSFILMYYYFDLSPIWLVAASLQNLWLLTIATKALQFDWFVANPYATALCLGLLGSALIAKRSIITGSVMLIVASWVNASLFLVLIPLILFRYLIRGDMRRMAQPLCIAVIGAAIGLLGKKLSHGPSSDSRVVPIAQWHVGWAELYRSASKAGPADSIAHHYLLLWMIVPACIALALLLRHEARRYTVAVATSWVITAIGYWLIVGTLAWTKLNLYSMRYLYPAMFLLAMAMAVLTVSPFQNISVRSGTVIAIVAALSVFAVSTYQYGVPSRGLVRRIIHNKFGAYTNDVLSTSAMLISGNYWTMWTSVFDANATLYHDQEYHRFIYGVGYRDSTTLPHWVTRPTVCAACLVGDPEGPYWLMRSPRHFAFVQRVNSIDLYCSTD